MSIARNFNLHVFDKDLQKCFFLSFGQLFAEKCEILIKMYLNGSNGIAFLWQKFCQNHLQHSNCLKIYIRGCKWANYQYTFYPFIRMVSLRPYCIAWICVCHKRAGPLDNFSNKLYSSHWAYMPCQINVFYGFFC